MLDRLALDLSDGQGTIKANTLRDYRRTSAAWPEEDGGRDDSVPWSVYWILSGLNRRARVLAKLIEEDRVSAHEARIARNAIVTNDRLEVMDWLYHLDNPKARRRSYRRVTETAES